MKRAGGFVRHAAGRMFADEKTYVPPNPQAAEYYLCGPPQMIRACTRLVAEFGVPAQQIAYDEF